MGKRKNGMVRNRSISVVAYFFLALFLAMIAYLIYFQVFKSEEFINSPYNTLQNLFADRVERGEILTREGVILAKTITTEDGEERVYPYGEMFAHVTGYAVNGKAGVESIANFGLLRSHQSLGEQIVNDLKEEKSIGDRVITTIDFDLQQAAYEAMGDYRGAVIAMDPTTGEILCMVSKPDYDPNRILTDWEEINAEGSTVLFNRATQGLYAPGSTFKIFTTMAYLREHPSDWQNYSYTCSGTIASDGTVIRCASGNSHGREDLQDSFARSCNCSYSNIGLSLNKEAYEEVCDSLLFNQKLPVAFLSAQSSFSLINEKDSGVIMQTAMGQGNTLITPLHMLMVTAAIANDGLLIKPRLILHTESCGGVMVKEYQATEYGSLITGEESSLMKEFMRSVITEGTGQGLSDTAYTCYGKTGTAQTSESLTETNAWFTGFAEKDGKQIAVTVILEDAGSGSAKAIPAAKAVFDSFFSHEESCE